MIGLAWLAVAGQAGAGPVLERVERNATLHCAAGLRPGFAGPGNSGVAADLCRDVAFSVAGPDARFTLALLDEVPQAAGTADLMFLSDDEIATIDPGERLLRGPVVFADPVALMVPVASAATTPGDLAGGVICLMIGSPGQRALEAGLGSITPPIIRQAFGEEVEMLDAYNVGRCDAAVGEASELSVMQRSRGVLGLRSRMVSPPLGETAIVAVTPAGDDAWTHRVQAALQARASIRRLRPDAR